MTDLMIDNRSPYRGGWAPMLKQWRIGSLVALLSFGCACFVVTQLTPVYRAYTQLLLPLKIVEDPNDRKASQSLQADAFVVKSFVNLIQDDGISRHVIRDLDLEKNPDFQPHATWLSDVRADINRYLSSGQEGPSPFSANEITRERVLEDYQSRMKAVSEGKSLTIQLSFDSHDPHLAEGIVTAHAKAFVQSEVDYRRQEAEAKVAWMKAELDRTAIQARDAQVALQLNPTALMFSKDMSAGAASALKMRQLQATATQAVYDSVLKQYQDMLAAQAYSGSEIRILSEATLPTHPNFPKKLLLAAAAAAVSLVLGCVACVIASVARKRVGVDSMVETLGLPILARINAPGATWSGFGQRARTKRAFFWQRIHELRSTINVTDKRHPITLVTSVMPKEGKSLVASALARTLAKSGLRTLLIDLNGRSSRYQLSLDRRSASSLGLQEYLEGSATAGQVAVQVDSASPLFLMTNKGTKATDLAALSGTKLKSRLTALKKEFDAIIVDAPALASLSDALQLAAYTDEIILTMLVGSEQSEQLKDDVAKIRARSAHLKGVIIVDKTAPNPVDLACIEGYALRDPLREIWPKAKPLPFSERGVLRKLFGRGLNAGKQAAASI